MTQKNEVEKIVSQAVSNALEGKLSQLQDELVRSVISDVLPKVKSSGEPSHGGSSQHLLQAVSSIHTATTQRDVLRTLLDNAAQYCRRVALFVVKGGAVTGWQARAFADNDTIKDFTLDSNSGLVSRVLDGHSSLSGKSKEMDQKFISQFGKPADDQCLLLPLILRDKVAALLYADSGLEQGHFDNSALQLLVMTTGTWLEVVSMRKAAPGHSPTEPDKPETPVAKASAAQAAPAFNDPFAAHTPAYAKAAAAASSSTAAEHSFTTPASEPGSEPNAFAGMSPQDADTHRKAQRFARLLVDEIKLYNQAKMTEGRKNKDLYDRLREDIDKSRATFQKRFGSTAAASGDYFNQEVIRSLAEDDVALLGPNFKR